MSKPAQTLGGGAVVTAAPTFTSANDAAQTAVTILTLPSTADYMYLVEITGTLNIYTGGNSDISFNILTPGTASFFNSAANDYGNTAAASADFYTTALNLKTFNKENYGPIKLLMGPGAVVTAIVSYNATAADASRTLNYSLAATYLGIKINN